MLVLAFAGDLPDHGAMPRSSVIVLLSMLLAVYPALADDLTSGPATDSALGKVSCYANSGSYSGKEFDAAKEIGSNSGALLFIHELTRNTAPVIRELNRLGEEHAVVGFEWFSILLDDDRTNGEGMLKRVNGSLKMANPLVLGLDGLEGPGDYALNREATLTLVLTKDGKVLRSIALKDTGPADFPKLREWVESAAGKVPEDPEALRDLIARRLPEDPEALKKHAVDQSMALRRLRKQLAKVQERNRGRMQPRRRPSETPDRPQRVTRENDPPAEGEAATKPKRRGKPPEDPDLNQLLRSFIRKTNDDAKSDTVFADIEKRAGESEALKTEAVEMFKLMLSFRDRYGNAYSQDLAEKFLKKHVVQPVEK